MRVVLEQLINALALGSIYALIALGVAMVFSILGVINFAHGEFLTVAGYSMLFLTLQKVSWVLIVPMSILSAVLTAIVLERIAFRPVRSAPAMTLLLTSYAASTIIQNTLLLSIGAIPKSLNFPAWVDSQIGFGGLTVQWLDVITLLTTLGLLFGLTLLLRRTVIGLALRSAAEDFSITRLMGVRADLIVVGAFAVSGALAGWAALFYFGSAPVVLPSSGLHPLLKGFIASVIGGLGSLPGAVVGGFLLAFLEVFFQATLPGNLTGYVDALVFVIVILILLFRPNGLLGRQGARGRV
ncbi:MAG TPA: branched-chain amino acid ABC transporter permease [Candidatus Dormibacteraeota bacterium]|nr:branched-chain amino acid ABC transporter permease [Candidatus Dormibacteraeota bacterium]